MYISLPLYLYKTSQHSNLMSSKSFFNKSKRKTQAKFKRYSRKNIRKEMRSIWWQKENYQAIYNKSINWKELKILSDYHNKAMDISQKL